MATPGTSLGSVSLGRHLRTCSVVGAEWLCVTAGGQTILIGSMKSVQNFVRVVQTRRILQGRNRTSHETIDGGVNSIPTEHFPAADAEHSVSPPAYDEGKAPAGKQFAHDRSACLSNEGGAETESCTGGHPDSVLPRHLRVTATANDVPAVADNHWNAKQAKSNK